MRMKYMSTNMETKVSNETSSGNEEKDVELLLIIME